MGVEDLLVVGGKREASTFVEGDDQDSGLDRGHGRGDERLRGIFKKVLDGRQRIEENSNNILIPLEFVVEILGVCETTGVSSPESPLMVDVEEDRVNVWVKGAKCVSFNSV